MHIVEHKYKMSNITVNCWIEIYFVEHKYKFMEHLASHRKYLKTSLRSISLVWATTRRWAKRSLSASSITSLPILTDEKTLVVKHSLKLAFVQWVVPPPDNVSSSRSVLSQRNMLKALGLTTFWSITSCSFPSRRFSASLISISRTWSYEIPWPYLFNRVMTYFELVRFFNARGKETCFDVFCIPFRT